MGTAFNTAEPLRSVRVARVKCLKVRIRKPLRPRCFCKQSLVIRNDIIDEPHASDRFGVAGVSIKVIQQRQKANAFRNARREFNFFSGRQIRFKKLLHLAAKRLKSPEVRLRERGHREIVVETLRPKRF
jgi:hypothetical protein